jgi:hypothetical protein
MLKRISAVLGGLALLTALAGAAKAQQLYVSTVAVGDGGGGYCNSGFLGVDRSAYAGLTGSPVADAARIEFERPQTQYPGGCLSLCVTIDCVVTSTPSSFGIDSLTFEIFKFGGGSNPLDPASTPPIRTVSLYNIGTCSCLTSACAGVSQHVINNATGGAFFCTDWDASYNLNGIFGKTNGQFGYRATVKTNQVSNTAGNISIEQTSAYPGQNQYPISVDVVNIHTVRSSPTVVGRITGVAAQPYNILYRLSKDATVSIGVYDANVSYTLPQVRHIITATPRTGEGTPDGTMTNGDFWDGRDDNGLMMPAGSYLVRIEAGANDGWQPATQPTDLAWPTTIQVALDPLQITDVGIKPLGASATDLATISYMLTEAATVYVNIFTPGTSITDINNMSFAGATPPYTAGTLLRTFQEQKTGRQPLTTIWDGRDSNGMPVCDGDYIYAIFAEMPGHNGTIRTKRLQVGTVPVARGTVMTLFSPSSTVVGSSPTAAGLDPFYFRYTPARDVFVSMNIRDMHNNIMRHVVKNEVRFANVSNRETWDGKKDDGTYVSSGTYLAELITDDPYQCVTLKTSTVTASIPVNMFRIVDVKTTPLLGGTSDMATVSFELSQPMYVQLNVYATSVTINPSQIWGLGGNPVLPGAPSASVVYSVQGMRPGRYKVTEYWDGRDSNGLLVPDGRYPFAMVAYTTSPVNNAQTMYATDQVYGYVDISRGQIIFSMFDVTPTVPTMYNSSDTIKLPPYEIDYAVTRQSSVTVQVLTLESPPKVVANVVSGVIRDGDMVYKDFWDGKDDNGNWANGYDAGGGLLNAYNVRVTAQDISAQMASRATVQMTIDVNPLRIFDVSITPLTPENPAVVSYQISEPMKMVTKIYKPGTTFNSYGTPSPAESTSLVKRIIGVRPSRTKVEEYWDGTDMTLSRVPDGNYVFKVFGSTMTDSISTLDGSYTSGTTLADDTITSDLPVTKGAAGTCKDFEKDTFFAPNPYVGTSGWFNIPVYINGRVTLRLYNLAGDLVYKKDFGSKGGNSVIGGNNGSMCAVTHTNEACWPKVNSYGKTVAPGVYFAVIRFEASDGTRDICQTVKKILVP